MADRRSNADEPPRRNAKGAFGPEKLDDLEYVVSEKKRIKELLDELHPIRAEITSAVEDRKSRKKIFGWFKTASVWISFAVATAVGVITFYEKWKH